LWAQPAAGDGLAASAERSLGTEQPRLHAGDERANQSVTRVGVVVVAFAAIASTVVPNRWGFPAWRIDSSA
jgi:hypothetical protein